MGREREETKSEAQRSSIETRSGCWLGVATLKTAALLLQSPGFCKEIECTHLRATLYIHTTTLNSGGRGEGRTPLLLALVF